MPDFKTSEPGELEIPHGKLLLPKRVVVGNDEEVAVAWSGWEGDQATGTAGVLQLNVRVEIDTGLHIQLEILNDSGDPVELREAAFLLVIDQPDSITLLPECGISTANPWDFVLTHETLSKGGTERRCLQLSYGDESWYAGSADPLRYADGLVRAEPDSHQGDALRISWHRVEPKWQYNGMTASRPLNGLWIHEGQTRVATLDFAADPASFERAIETPDADPARVSLCKVPAQQTYDWAPIMEAITRMRMTSGEYVDLFAGGYDHRNQRILEPHVSRPEYGEFLLHEFLRTGDAQLWEWVLAFAEAFQRVSLNRSSDPQRGGAVRGRYGDNDAAHPIRSMRGSAFFWDMAEITGNESYRTTAVGIADFLTRVFPWTNARQAAAVRDLVYMHRVTGEARYLETSQKIIEVLVEVQQPDGAWHEYWNEKGEAYVYDPPSHHGGEWTLTSPLKPEMQTYNVNGLIDALTLAPDLIPEAEPITRRAAEWLADAQDASGAWPFPQKSSKGLFGYALMLDASAMLKAGKYFGEESFVDAGRRGIEWGLNQIKERGYVPALLGLPDADQVESSLTCFYALEAFAAAESV